MYPPQSVSLAVSWGGVWAIAGQVLAKVMAIAIAVVIVLAIAIVIAIAKIIAIAVVVVILSKVGY